MQSWVASPALRTPLSNYAALRMPDKVVPEFADLFDELKGSVAEVAQTMRVSTMTVYRLVKAGDLAATRIGRSYRIAEHDVDQYLASRYTQAG